MVVTREFLEKNPNVVFVFGDNQLRRGKGGAAALRDCKNTYGFITKKYPSNNDDAFFTPEEYEPVFQEELAKLCDTIQKNPDKMFLISKVGGGLANKYNIFEEVIAENLIEALENFENVTILY